MKLASKTVLERKCHQERFSRFQVKENPRQYLAYLLRLRTVMSEKTVVWCFLSFYRFSGFQFSAISTVKLKPSNKTKS